MRSFQSLLHKPYLLIASLICLALSQCRDFDDCRTLYSSMVSIEFVPYDEKAYTEAIAFNSVALDTRSVTGQVKSLGNAGKSFAIGLNPKADSTTVYFHQAKPKLQTDTLTIFYQRYASLISPKCGLQQEYVIDSLIYTGFIKDSIMNPTPKTEISDKNEQTNVQIFY